jgi:hypothetical protein
MTRSAAAITPTDTVHRIVVSTNYVPTGRVGIHVGPYTIATVKNGGDMIRNIDAALTRNGFVRTAAFHPVQGLANALSAEAVKVR